MFGIIYGAECLVNHKIYIGQTVRILEKRIIEHKSNKVSLISRAIHKYGEENFVWVTLEECDSREQLNEREIFWIKTLDTKFPNGYNLTDGGKGNSGYICSAETRAKLSLAKRGKKCSLETRTKIAASNKGKVRSPEQRARISQSKMGNKNSAGRVFTTEHCARISVSKMGHPVSQETREKLSIAHKGKILSPEHRAKMSESQKRRFKKD